MSSHGSGAGHGTGSGDFSKNHFLSEGFISFINQFLAEVHEIKDSFKKGFSFGMNFSFSGFFQNPKVQEIHTKCIMIQPVPEFHLKYHYSYKVLRQGGKGCQM